MDLLVDGRKAMLEGLVDYAGLFPPTSLDLETAVATYRDARHGPHGWMLGRFLCPTSQLENLAGVLTRTMTAGEATWGVSAIFDGPTASGDAATFDRHMDPGAKILLAEVKAPAAATDGRDVVDATDALLPVVDGALAVSTEITPFVELDRGPAWGKGVESAVAGIAALRTARLRAMGAKLRTGGLTADAFPTPDEVAAFIVACARHGVPFKVTAGLHHPVRHSDAELGVERHGFLNVVLGAALATGGAAPDTVAAAISETDPSALDMGVAGLRWRDHRFGVAALRKVRHHVFPAYGSCSFDEPVEDLMAMGVVTAVAPSGGPVR